MVLKKHARDNRHFTYVTFTLYGRLSQNVQLCRYFVTLRIIGRLSSMLLQPDPYNARQLSRTDRLGCSRFARRYYGNLG